MYGDHRYNKLDYIHSEHDLVGAIQSCCERSRYRKPYSLPCSTLLHACIKLQWAYKGVPDTAHGFRLRVTYSYLPHAMPVDHPSHQW